MLAMDAGALARSGAGLMSRQYLASPHSMKEATAALATRAVGSTFDDEAVGLA
jgi:hypothetical protein